MFDELKTEVCRVNKALVDTGLVILTWGNVSGVDRKADVMAIKPSGVPYEGLTPDDIVVLKISDGSVVADDVSQKSTNTGYDANTGKYVDMFKAGIIDPVKVVRTALANAASISGLMLTTEALVTNLDKEDKEKTRVEGSIR